MFDGSELIVGGSFHSVGGLLRTNIAKVSAFGTASVDPEWNPNAIGYITAVSMDGVEAGAVWALAADTANVYVGGAFYNIGDAARTNVAKLSTTGNGAADPLWNADTDGQLVAALAVSGSSVFAGGDFATINGVVSLSVAKLSPVTGVRDDSFTAQVGFPGRTTAVARQADGKVIAGGDFYLVGSFPCQNLARFNVDGTLDTTWLPRANGRVEAIAIQGTDIFVTGEFSRIGGQSRRSLAKLSVMGTGEADAAWGPNLSGPVDALAIESTNLYVASGFFGSVVIVKLSTAGTGQANADWNPGRFECFGGLGFDKALRSLAVNATSVYVAGDFEWISRGADSVERRGLVKLSATGNGAPDLQWNPSSVYGIRALTLDDTHLYVTGFSGLARVSATGTGEPDPDWHPDLLSGVVDVMVLSETHLYAGGSVTTASGLTNATLVRLPTTGTGAIDPTWNPNPHRSGVPFPLHCVNGLAVNGTDVYVIGDFDTIGGTTRHSFAFLPVADAPVMVQGPRSIVFIRRSPNDGPEVTHFRITDIQGGNLYLADSLAPVKANNFVTVEQGEAGLRFFWCEGTASITAVSAISPILEGTGSAATTLVLTGEPASCLLWLSLREGLTLVGCPGRTYQIEYTESLNAPINWLPLTTVRLAGDTLVVPGTLPANRVQRFYRAVLVP